VNKKSIRTTRGGTERRARRDGARSTTDVIFFFLRRDDVRARARARSERKGDVRAPPLFERRLITLEGGFLYTTKVSIKKW